MPDIPSLDTWREAFSVFERLVALDGQARARELAALEKTRPELSVHVLSLLNAGPQTQAEAMINAEAIGSAGVPGAQFGDYRLESQLGSGGMGEVWLASRADGLYESKAAVKLLHPYLSSSRVRERFAREGQILGRLSHPHIARLLDAGIGPGGALYLVLEHVAGLRIDAWCDQQQLDLPARVRLFLQVCEAVAYAHAHLVIHRDLKPANILVTAEGSAKLLDFGIAKLLEPDDRDAELTRLGGMALTPEYAAPEQLSGDPVSTAADVYTLGLLLHLLLSGRHPFAEQLGNPTKLAQAVREQEPSPMSQAVAASRQQGQPQLARALRGDLDNIVVKALRKIPAERYVSVLALADDLQRYLKHEPVQARPESLLYRARKFLRRHWMGAAAATAVAASLIAGVAGIVWQSRIARLEAAKATAVKDFLVGIFEHSSTIHPDGAAARKVSAEELLDLGAQRIRDELLQVPEVRIELLDTIGGLYHSLLVRERSIELREEALAAARAYYRDEHHPKVLAARVALGATLVNSNEVERGRALLEAALHHMDLIGDDRSRLRAAALHNLAAADYLLGTAENPLSRSRAVEALDILRRHHPGSDEEIEVLHLLGNIEEFGDHDAASEAWYRQALDISAKTRDTTLVAVVHQDYGDLLRGLGRIAEAEQHLRKAHALLLRASGAGSTLTADAEVQIGDLLVESQRAQEAMPLLERAVASLSRNYGAATGRTSEALLELGNAQMARGLILQAERSLRLAAEARKDSADGANSRAAVLVRLIAPLTLLARWSEAEPVLAEGRRIILDVYGENTPAHGVILQREAELRLAQGRSDEAQRIFADLLERWPREPGKFPSVYLKPLWGLAEIEIRSGAAVAAARRLRPLLRELEQSPQRTALADAEAITAFELAWALQASGRAAEALPLLQQALRLRAKLDDDHSLWLARPRLVLAATLLDLKRRTEAEAAYRSAAATLDAYPQLAPTYTLLRQQVAARLGVPLARQNGPQRPADASQS